MMQFNALCLAVFFAPTTALLAPVAGQAPPGSFSLSVSKKDGAARDFIRDWAAARHKWGGSIPEHVSKTFSLANSDGRIDAKPIGNDEIYVADVGFGNPPQTLKIALDTGSSDLWVQSTDTSYQINSKGPWAPKYKPNASNTSHIMNNAQWAVEYMDGTTATGIAYHDTVRMAGFEVKNATVQSAKTIASRFESETGLTGIMGLAKQLPSSIEPPTPSFLTLLKQQLSDPVFAVDFRRNAPGQFYFGHINQSLASENMTWVESSPDSPHWDIGLDLTSWTSKKPTWWYSKFQATIDTGTTLIFLPDTLANMYWSSVEGMRVDPRLSNAFTFPCGGADSLPDLKFKLPKTEHVLTIPGPYLNYGPIDSNPEHCWGGMQSADGMDVTILGDVMLKALFVVFDMGKNRIGFANKVLHDLD